MPQVTVSYVWQAPAFPACRTDACGPIDDLRRTVTCMVITTSEGEVSRVPEQLADGELTQCAGNEPLSTKVCATPQAGAPCDDGNDETMNDVCTSEEVGSCAGEVQLAAAVTLPIDTSLIRADILAELTSDDVDTETLNDSPVAAPIKASLAAALSVEADVITLTKLETTGNRRRRLQDDGLSVDYVVSLPPIEAAAAKTSSENMQVPDVVIPADATEAGTAVTIAQADIDAQPLQSYTYVKTAGTCEANACSASHVCGAAAVTAADVYACKEDGAVVDATLCLPVLGEEPTTQTECCPAADPLTCTQSDADIIAAAEEEEEEEEEVVVGDIDLNEKTSAAPAVAAPLSALVLALVCALQR